MHMQNCATRVCTQLVSVLRDGGGGEEKGEEGGREKGRRKEKWRKGKGGAHALPAWHPLGPIPVIDSRWS